MDQKQIGQKIKELRTRMGLTTITLAKKVRLSQAQISRLENGLQGFRSATMVKFAKALNVPTMYFYVEGVAAATDGVTHDLDKRGMRTTRTLRNALANPAFLRFLERCAKPFNRSVKNLEKMQAATNRVVRGV